ncbi:PLASMODESMATA CALLOSE-BINDING PROTEIN 2-like [Rutidosis leptorrhynchoides]|uniref:PLASMODESMATA CALLOSE-BINDING PROTEIN 2-like n=1 Tax=Rutidosis leptorrhynchoides TaxID=125765 RepID=UPI003A9A63C8
MLLLLLLLLHGGFTAALWCVARSDASREALQIALDYACSAGADCAPLQPTGLCFLPNTIQAHASYAFNSYYMRKSMAPGSCDFSGTATIAKTDPSYGSCVYPPSPSSAGGTIPVTTPVSGSIVPPPPMVAGLTTPIGNGMVPTLNTPPDSKGFRTSSISTFLHINNIFMVFLFIFHLLKIFS